MLARGLATITTAAGLLLPITSYANPVARTGTGGSANSVTAAPYTASSGKTVPQPSAFDPTTTGSVSLQSPRRKDAATIRRDSIIMKGICIGCD